jgi:hypothetical protein
MSYIPACDNCGEYPGHAVSDSIDRLRAGLEAIRDGYGPNHLSKFARDVAAKTLAPKEAKE